MSGFIDGHSHYMPPKVAENTMFFKAGWSDVDAQLKLMDQNEIAKSLILYPTSDAHLNLPGGWSELSQIYNEAIAELVKKYPDRFIGAGILPIGQSDLYVDTLIKMKEAGLKVLSLASSYDGVYLDDPQFYPVYAACAKVGMPVHVHAQIINPIGEDRVRDPLLSPVLEYVFDVSMCVGKMMMEEVFAQYPQTSFIFAHFGGVLPLVKERFDTTYVMLRGRDFVKDLGAKPSDILKNCYFDTSGTKSSAALACALELVDADHVIFGSDYPANKDIAGGLKVINDFDLSEISKKRILSNPLLQNC